MTIRRGVFVLAVLAGVIVSLVPAFTRERNITVHDHHLDHFVLMFFGVIAGLARYERSGERESPAWLWPAILCPFVVMLLMSPGLYAVVDGAPWLHVYNHLLFFLLAAVTAYAGQRYVRGVGWASAILLESMALVAAFGYGVAPAATSGVAGTTGAAATTSAPATTRAAGTGAGVVQSAGPAGGDVAAGKVIYARNCAVCHGVSGGGGEGPALRGESTRKNFSQTVTWIEKPAPPMPALYPSVLNANDVGNVAAYVQSLK